jgi:hypothetical protein
LAFERVAAVNERLDRVAAPECVLDHQPAHLPEAPKTVMRTVMRGLESTDQLRGKLTDFHARLPAVLPPQLGQLPALLAGHPPFPVPASRSSCLTHSRTALKPQPLRRCKNHVTVISYLKSVDSENSCTTGHGTDPCVKGMGLVSDL